MEGHGGCEVIVTEFWEIKGACIYAPDLYKALDYMAKTRARHVENFGDAEVGPIVLVHDGDAIRVQYTRPFQAADE